MIDAIDAIDGIDVIDVMDGNEDAMDVMILILDHDCDWYRLLCVDGAGTAWREHWMALRGSGLSFVYVRRNNYWYLSCTQLLIPTYIKV